MSYHFNKISFALLDRNGDEIRLPVVPTSGVFGTEGPGMSADSPHGFLHLKYLALTEGQVRELVHFAANEVSLIEVCSLYHALPGSENGDNHSVKAWVYGSPIFGIEEGAGYASETNVGICFHLTMATEMETQSGGVDIELRDSDDDDQGYLD